LIWKREARLQKAGPESLQGFSIGRREGGSSFIWDRRDEFVRGGKHLFIKKRASKWKKGKGENIGGPPRAGSLRKSRPENKGRIGARQVTFAEEKSR